MNKIARLFFVLSVFVLLFEPTLYARESKNHKRKGKFTADYIIVGGGTAGCVLARRLSEKYTVILLEAGANEDNNPLITDPLANGALVLADTNQFFWPLGHSLLATPPNNRRFAGVAGELLGGGSSVNGLQYVRGTHDFYAAWEGLVNDADWGPENAFKQFKKMETFNGIPGQFIPQTHGEHGPVDIRQAANNVPAAQNFVNALVSLGFPEIKDYNDPFTLPGPFVYWQLFEKPNLMRESSSTAYLEGYIKQKKDHLYVSSNKNLRLYTKAHADQILFSSATQGNTHADKAKRRLIIPRAKGVRAVVNNQQIDFFAKRKVILCAGAFNSPLLLQVSGIGNESDLKSLNIPVVLNNPNVGRQILNHPLFTLTGLGNVPSSTSDPEGLYAGGAFLPDPSTPSDLDRGLELIGIATPNPTNPNQGAFTIATLILTAKSAGFIQPFYSDYFRMPKFDFHYFQEQSDFTSAIAAYTIMYQTLVKMGLSPLGPNPSDSSAVMDYIFAHYDQAYHYTKSCLMSTSPATGVVDSSGRVFGVKGLMVADNSIVPLNARGNTAATAFLIGNVIANKLLHKRHSNR
jgi:choline dehydrogenase